MSAAIRTVAFIGLGLMGRLMAANLEKAGFIIQSFDLNGSGNCPSAKEAAKGAQVLITMVPDGKAVRKAVLAALPGLAPGSIVIDMSSSDPSDTRKLNAILKKKNIRLLDAPVSGAKAKAADGTLAIMVGGDAGVLERVRPVLSKMGTEIFLTGALGSGHATKALNNYLGGAGTIAGFEALLVGEKFGLDPKVLIDVINASTGRNSTTERKIPQQIFTGAFASGFALALMAKDVGIAREIAREVGVETPYLKNTLKIWRDALSRLPAGADHTEMYHYLKKLKSPSRGAASPRARSRHKRRRST
ncbi:MAG TPA: NAD(P)-dependent oxidoreductase [Candidatus Eremiobacteraceae bacterium]|nr:NAD(P)-dependent oxidoreductase [Candidatus Eremiobacteraceae bacterium]